VTSARPSPPRSPRSQAHRRRLPRRRHRDDVAATILDALANPVHRVQRPVGDDARAIFDRRADVSLDEFVALGGDVSDEHYRAWFATNFDLEL
jgi:hypothetical protein